jgi:hypothetical protein
MPGKIDWLACGLAVEGEQHSVLRVKDVVRDDVVRARLTSAKRWLGPGPRGRARRPLDPAPRRRGANAEARPRAQQPRGSARAAPRLGYWEPDNGSEFDEVLSHRAEVGELLARLGAASIPRAQLLGPVRRVVEPQVARLGRAARRGPTRPLRPTHLSPEDRRWPASSENGRSMDPRECQCRAADPASAEVMACVLASTRTD